MPCCRRTADTCNRLVLKVLASRDQSLSAALEEDQGAIYDRDDGDDKDDGDAQVAGRWEGERQSAGQGRGELGSFGRGGEGGEGGEGRGGGEGREGRGGEGEGRGGERIIEVVEISSVCVFELRLSIISKNLVAQIME